MPGTLLDNFSAEATTRALKLSSGIGDNDGFPALDAFSDDYATKEKSKWGFLVTGGAEFHMPLTIYQVASIGLGAENDLHVGDIILEINEEDATQLTLSQAREKIEASKKKLHLVIKTGMTEESMDYETGEERNVVLRMPKPNPLPGLGIENRLSELQYKLSELAEIPNILSSALETVGEVVHDIMWSDPMLETLTEVSTEAEDDNSSCYEESSMRADNESFDECYNNELDSDTESERVYNFKINDGSLEEDDLTTSLTLHLKKRKNKLENAEDEYAGTEETELSSSAETKESTPVDPPKLSKLESAWPWADRQKIIYKQSTCHLVSQSNKVLGLVEQRMQLLEKNKKKHEM